MTLRQTICTLMAFCLAYASLPSVLTGVYPNYRPHFDFTAWDNEQNLTALDEAQKWWEVATFYQIYPRSFKDSNGDGIGDLNGITEQLYYLKEIGIAATWLSPIYKSPMADFGYDIANYTEIARIFGTMADFEALIAKANELGLKIILDFVPNHTSDESEWFVKSAAKDPVYKDFYVWHPGKIVNGTRQPPTNWISVFHGSAWQWHEGRQEYYLHEFLAKQPDLNYRNPKVCEAMKEVLRFWLRKGVYGFRVDAVPFLFEVPSDATGNWPDEPRNDDVHDPTDYGYLKHIYTVDQPETLDMVYQWHAVLDKFQKENGGDERVMLTEAYTSIEITMKYYGNDTVDGAQIPFNFLIIENVYNNSDAYHYASTVNDWLTNMPQGRTPNWVIGNHDQNRVGSRLGTDRIDMMNMLVLTLPGCGITYMGEEIGMTDVWISWNDTVDPSACNTNPDVYEKFSRDPERTPFQWNDGMNAGFSNATKTWLPIASNYKEVNTKTERSFTRSHLNIYKQLQNLRKEHTLRHGDVDVRALSTDVLSVKRTLLGDYTYVMLMNIYENAQVVNLTKTYEKLQSELVYVIVTPQTNAQIGFRVNANEINLAPMEAIVLRTITKLTTTAGYYTYYTPEKLPSAID